MLSLEHYTLAFLDLAEYFIAASALVTVSVSWPTNSHPYVLTCIVKSTLRLFQQALQNQTRGLIMRHVIPPQHDLEMWTLGFSGSHRRSESRSRAWQHFAENVNLMFTKSSRNAAIQLFTPAMPHTQASAMPRILPANPFLMNRKSICLGEEWEGHRQQATEIL